MSTGDSLAPSPQFDAREGLALLVASVVDYAIFTLDTTGVITSWNPGARRLKGYEAHEIIGRHFSVFYPPEDRDKPARELVEAEASGRIEDEGWRVRKDGSRFWANVVITALRANDGTLRGFGKVTRDLTERKEAEDILRAAVIREQQAAERLLQADRAKDELVAMVAHDLRAPIGVLHGSADMLVRDWDRLDERGRVHIVESMRETSARLMALVGDVLDVTRLEAGRLTYDLRDVEVVPLLRRAARDVDPDGRRVDVTGPSTPVTVHADAQRLWQIAVNLMGNALKFSPVDRPVCVSVEAGASTVDIAVRDEGVGIAHEDQGRIFRRFARLESGLFAPGSGLGLYLARSLAVAQGGDITVRSEPGEGSTFTVRLPRGVAGGGD